MPKIYLIDPDKSWYTTAQTLLNDALTAATCQPVLSPDFIPALTDADVILCTRDAAGWQAADVLQHIQSHGLLIPVIVIGAADDADHHIVDVMRAGAADYIRASQLGTLANRVQDVLAASPDAGLHDKVISVMDNAPVMFLHTDPDGVVRHVYGYASNQSAAHVVLVGQNIMQYGMPGNEPTFAEQAQAGQPFVYRLKTGDVLWDVYCQPLSAGDAAISHVLALAIDVTRDLYLADELLNSDERFIRLFRMIPEPCLILSVPDGQILAANTTFQRLIGRPDEILTGHNITALADSSTDGLWSKILNHGQLTGLTGRILPINGGAAVDVQVSAMPLELINIRSVLVTLADVTEANAQKAQLASSEQKLRTIIDEMSDIILIINAETRLIESVNPAVYHMLGYSPHTLIGKTFSTMLMPDDAQADAIFEELAAYGAVFEPLRLVSIDGRKLSVDMTATIITWEGQPAVLMNMRDVTEREIAMKALHEAEERLRTVINNLPVMLTTFDRRGVFTLSAGSGLEVLGLRSGQAIGQSAFEIYRRFPELIEDVRAALHGESFRVQRQIKGRYLEIYYTPLLNINQKLEGVISIAMDITARVDAQKSRLEAERIRLEMEQDRQRMAFRAGFTSMAAHEFRTPLAVIMTATYLAKTLMTRGEGDDWQRHLNRIGEQVQYMTRLIDEMLLVSDGQKGQMAFEPEVINFSDLCTQVVHDLRLDTIKTHTFINEIDQSQTALYLDPSLMRHVVTNLLQNAIKYTPEGGHIHLKTQIEEYILVITVADTGIGIPADDLVNLFEMFVRASNTGTISGSGLGLALVKYCMDAHGGSIEVESTVGEGTIFTVRVPLGEPPH